MKLVVVGMKEKAHVEKMFPILTEDIREVYHSTKEGNGQRWLMIHVDSTDDVFKDVLKIICICRECK